jgi:hypothetical protein
LYGVGAGFSPWPGRKDGQRCRATPVLADEGNDLETKLLGIGIFVQLSQFSGFLCGLGGYTHEGRVDLSNTVAHRAGPGIKLGGDVLEETSPRKHLAFDIGNIALDEGPQAAEPWRSLPHRSG